MTTDDTEIRKEISRRLKETREYLGLSQDEVANAVNLPRSAISLIESGSRKVEALELKNFARAYNQPVSYFIGEKEIDDLESNTEIAYLARTATELSTDDQKELLRFAEFLKTKKKT